MCDRASAQSHLNNPRDWLRNESGLLSHFLIKRLAQFDLFFIGKSVVACTTILGSLARSRPFNKSPKAEICDVKTKLRRVQPNGFDIDISLVCRPPPAQLCFRFLPLKQSWEKGKLTIASGCVFTLGLHA